MQVILTKEVLGLGDPGEIVKVKPGYGRNYLIPQGMAIEATKKNLAMIEAEQKRIQKRLAAEAEKMRSESQRLEEVSLVIKAKAGETGKLYGSVTNMDLAKALAEQGIEIDRRRIILEAPIKSLGEHPFRVKLHPHVVVDMVVTVESETPPPEEKPAEEAAEAAGEETQGEEAAAEAPAEGEAQDEAQTEAQAEAQDETGEEKPAEE